jgi:uncharacterized protein (TIGR00251 family)
MESFFHMKDDIAYIEIKAVPGASKTEIAGIKDQHLRVRLAAPPEDGKANAELCAFFSKILGCPKRDIRIEKGEKSRKKMLAFPARYVVLLISLMEEQP